MDTIVTILSVKKIRRREFKITALVREVEAGIKPQTIWAPEPVFFEPLSFVYFSPPFTPSLPGIQGLLLSSTGLLLRILMARVMATHGVSCTVWT